MIISRTEYEHSVIATDGKNTWFENAEYEYECNKCGEYIHESYPHHEEPKNNYHLCWDCCFKEGLIDSKKYMKFSGGLDGIFDAYIHNGEIELVKKGKTPYWLRDGETDNRFTSEYKEWRTKVFERDDYTCQSCGQVGGELNAHHIKPYSDYPKLRIDIDNGIALCYDCHRKEHRGD